jgi:hypothetical protein
MIHIVTYKPIARQRLGKHIPAQTYARKKRKSIPMHRSVNNLLSNMEAVFCVVRTEGL